MVRLCLHTRGSEAQRPPLWKRANSTSIHLPRAVLGTSLHGLWELIVTSSWQVERNPGENIYTAESGKPKVKPCFFLKSQSRYQNARPTAAMCLQVPAGRPLSKAVLNAAAARSLLVRVHTSCSSPPHHTLWQEHALKSMKRSSIIFHGR